jgi:murein DD-endopeptidase MepM/ murein hydrolase activator NlpD
MTQTVFNRRIFFIGLVILMWALALLPTLSHTRAQEPVPTATTTPIPQPLPTTVLQQEGVTLELYFPNIPQGGLGLVHVYGEGLAGARARFLNELTDFYPTNGGYYGLLAVSMEQGARDYELSLFVWFDDGRRATINTEVEVTLGSFIRQDFAVPPERAYLIDPQVERGEFARLESIFEPFTEDKYWVDGGFALPLNSEFTSPFGAYRMLNSTVQTRHTGWDLRAATGTPVSAMASGEVAFAGLLDIRGNYVVIDHGYGLYSGYAHLSQIHVTRGQSIVKGQIIGVSGNTGRSNGPHLHWEINLNGQWVDSQQFITMWLP